MEEKAGKASIFSLFKISAYKEFSIATPFDSDNKSKEYKTKTQPLCDYENHINADKNLS